jgi:hypothetical protein
VVPRPRAPPLGVRRQPSPGGPALARPSTGGLAVPSGTSGTWAGLIHNDIRGPFSPGRFLRIRFGVRNQPANSRRAHRFIRREGWAAGFVGITLPHQRMAKRHHRNRTLQEETTASSLYLHHPVQQTARQNQRVRPAANCRRGRSPRSGFGSRAGRSENAPDVSTLRCALTSAQTRT